jgi:hypothetical protein
MLQNSVQSPESWQIYSRLQIIGKTNSKNSSWYGQLSLKPISSHSKHLIPSLRGALCPQHLTSTALRALTNNPGSFYLSGAHFTYLVALGHNHRKYVSKIERHKKLHGDRKRAR